MHLSHLSKIITGCAMPKRGSKIVWFTKRRAQELWLQKAYLNATATAFLLPPNATASP
jgi:hypothetical protein